MLFSLSHRLARRIQHRMYYGWVIVAVVLVSNLIAFSLSVTFGLYITPLEAEFGWSRASISLGYALGPIAGALAAPLWGFLVDRLGVRWMMVLAGMMGGISLILMGHIQALWHLYVVYSVAFMVLYTGVAQLMGAVSVTQWFVRRRGRALGIVMMGASGGGFLFVPIQNLLIEVVGWRSAFTIYGGLAMLLIVVPALLLMGNNPEQYGQHNHKELAPAAAGSATRKPENHPDWTLAEAMRTQVFWVLLIGIMLATVTVAGYFTHVVPHLENLGFSRTAASTAWSFFFFIGMISKFFWGFISERLAARWCLVICMAGECIGLLLLMSARTTTDLIVYGIVTGIGHGPFLQLVALIWGNYFGRRHIGSIMGAVQPAAVMAGAVGPFVGGVMFDYFGNYQLFLWLLVATAAMAGVLFAMAPPPVRGTSPSAEREYLSWPVTRVASG